MGDPRIFSVARCHTAKTRVPAAGGDTRLCALMTRRLLGVTGCCGGVRMDGHPAPLFRGAHDASYSGIPGPRAPGEPGAFVSLAPLPGCGGDRSYVG